MIYNTFLNIIQTMSFRKYNKPNPFDAAKRNINLKLYEI